MNFEDLQKLKDSCYVVVKKHTIMGGDDPSTDEEVVKITQVTSTDLQTMAERDPTIVAFELRSIRIKTNTKVTNIEGDKL